MRKPHLAKDIRCDFCEESFPSGVFEPFLDKYICFECAKLGVKAMASAIELMLPPPGKHFKERPCQPTSGATPTLATEGSSATAVDHSLTLKR